MGSMEHTSRGFAYIGLLVTIVILGAALAAVGEVWSTQARREREVELLYRGAMIRRAIGAYVLSAGGLRYPQTLEDLLLDSRTPQVRRYLRRVYEDPVTGQADWTLIRAPDGGIMGVASSSQLEPLKKSGFSPYESVFADAKCYCDWMFIYQPRTLRPALPDGYPIPNASPTGSPSSSSGSSGPGSPAPLSPGAIHGFNGTTAGQP
jgi:type II secretory pathway pseudopilin PulG